MRPTPRKARSTSGIAGHGAPVAGSRPHSDSRCRSVTQPAAPQLVIATDIVKPPGVVMRRGGAASCTARTAAAMAGSHAKPGSSTAPSQMRSSSGRSSEANRSPSGGVMEDHAQGEALAAAHAADAVAQLDAIGAARALHGPVMDGEDHRLALSERHDLALRLRARALLDQQEFAAGEIRGRDR